MKKKVDSRVRTLIENGVALNQRTFFVLVGDRGKDQVGSGVRLDLPRAATCSPVSAHMAACARARAVPGRQSALHVVSRADKVAAVGALVLQEGAGLYHVCRLGVGGLRSVATHGGAPGTRRNA